MRSGGGTAAGLTRPAARYSSWTRPRPELAPSGCTVGPILRDLQDGGCFYCEGPLPGDFHVDHFIPWRRYPVDLGHNFVLAHAGCNSSKGDRLAAEEHLARWVERNEAHGDALENRFVEANVLADLGASRNVTAWAYSEVERTGGTVWVGGTEVRPLTEGWRGVMR